MGEEGAGAAVQGAAAEDYGGNGALGLGVGDAHEAAGLGFVNRHFGDERDAHAGADHGEEAGEVAAFENNARVEAGTVAGSDGGVAEAMAVAKEKEWIAAEVRELQRRAAGEFVRFWQSGEEAFGEEGMCLALVAANWEGQDGNVDGASAETFEEKRGDFFGDGKMSLGKFAVEAGEARGEPIGSDGGNGSEDDGARFRLQALCEFILGAGEFVENGTRAGQKCLAQIGETHGAAEAIEEAAAEFGFEFLDLLRERRLRDVAFFRGAREGRGVGDGAEVAELVEFHGEGSNQ